MAARRRAHRGRLLRGDRPAGLPRRGGRRAAAGAGPGDHRRRGAHARVHGDRARRPEVRLLARLRRRRRGGAAGARAAVSSSSPGCTRTSARRSSTPPASRWPRTGSSSWPARIRAEHGGRRRGARPGRRVRHRVHAGGRPARGQVAGGRRCARSWRRSARPSGSPVPRLTIEPGRGIVGPSTVTLYEVGTIKDVDGIRTYVSVDGGMSDNIRTALYDADYTCVLASRLIGRAADAVPGGRQALRERRHRGAALLPAGGPGAWRPARRRGDRRVLPVARLELQPPAAPWRGGGAATARRARSSAARRWTTCCDWTSDERGSTIRPARCSASRCSAAASSAPQVARLLRRAGRRPRGADRRAARARRDRGAAARRTRGPASTRRC